MCVEGGADEFGDVFECPGGVRNKTQRGGYAEFVGLVARAGVGGGLVAPFSCFFRP